MIKILHTADVHLDSPLKSLALRNPELRQLVEGATRTAFSRIVDVAVTERVAALLIAGDLFDGKQRSARTAAFLVGQLDRLRTAGIAVFYIKGNHDAENPITGGLDLPDNVHVFDARGGKVPLGDDIWVHGVSFADRHAPDSLLPKFPEPVPQAVNIALMHTSLAGVAGHDVYAPCALGDLLAMNFDYWALGHVHKRQVHAEAPWVVMPGMPQGRDIGEAGPKSASLLTIQDGAIRVDAVRTSEVEFAQSAVDVSDCETEDALRTTLRMHLQTIAQNCESPACVVRLALTGTTALHWQILRDQDVWRAQIDDMARDTDVLWIDKVVFDIAAPAIALSDGHQSAANATVELGETMDTVQAEQGFIHAARGEIDAILGDMPASVRARLLPDEASADALVTTSASNGAARVLARMKGSVG
ncbi:putative metallophosphoesterase YhaO [Ascidiaceihabitans donghaensis]|uniref:Putative metallophosphoesterase YhaO n=1 Tax=Ascidiaceihabitans donghaensis TaxID=1510460 RepID=A0A2R8BBH5_9RHOB|nr:DNA repair exonuclease [Ascidiaceihabitans donghaensis]SPH20391.1 putative metallophosphoesterase YhaO [Ascidiaceihabitans donghaensis]